MRKLTLLIALLLIFGFCTFAQTKRIAHRSHSANLNNYAIFQTNDNLGDAGAMIKPEPPLITHKNIDSTRILDSLNKARKIDSLKKLYIEKKTKNTLHQKHLKDLDKKKTHKAQKSVKQQFPIVLLLLIAIPSIVIALIYKK